MNIGQRNITLIQWLSLLSSLENKALNLLSSLMSTFKKALKKDISLPVFVDFQLSTF